MRHFTKTSARSPRANSSFKTTESRETYRMVEEILDILKRETPNHAIACTTIVNRAHALGYCRPLEDEERIAVAHPYWKVLSDMTDPESPKFINNLEEIDYCGRVLFYRLRTDVHRTAKGNWRLNKGARLIDSMPENK